MTFLVKSSSIRESHSHFKTWNILLQFDLSCHAGRLPLFGLVNIYIVVICLDVISEVASATVDFVFSVSRVRSVNEAPSLTKNSAFFIIWFPTEKQNKTEAGQWFYHCLDKKTSAWKMYLENTTYCQCRKISPRYKYIQQYTFKCQNITHFGLLS